RHAARLARDTVGPEGFIPAFDARVAADALLAGSGRSPVESLLVRAALDALAIAAATLLVDQDDAILGPLVDRLTRARSQAAGVGAVVADAGQVEEPDTVLGQLGRAAEPLVSPLAAGGGIFVDVGVPPLGVRRQVAQGHLRPLGPDVGR